MRQLKTKCDPRSGSVAASSVTTVQQRLGALTRPARLAPLLLGSLVALSTLMFSPSAVHAQLPIGSGFAGTNNTPAERDSDAQTLQNLNIKPVRIVMSYDSAPVNQALSDLLTSCEQHGLKPMLLVEYYKNYGTLNSSKQGGSADTVYAFWFSYGQRLAQAYGTRIAVYSAINEPDLQQFWNGVENTDVFSDTEEKRNRGRIAPADYFQAIKGYADGIHSVNAAFKVVPGGFVGDNGHQDATNKGYSSVLAELFNDTPKTLDGLMLHNYKGTTDERKESEQDQFDRTKAASGITADVNHYCDEFNAGRGALPGESAADAKIGNARVFMTHLWNNLGVVGKDGDGTPVKTVFTMPYTLFKLNKVNNPGNGNAEDYGMANTLTPWVGDERADTMQLVNNLTKDLSFTSARPHTTGVYELTGAGKKMWVWQNYPLWSELAGTSFTLSGVPAGANSIKVYRAENTVATPYRTLAVNGQSTVQVTGLPTDETLMFVSSPDAPLPPPPPAGTRNFDFTTETGALATGYTRVTPQLYSSATGFGYTITAWIYNSDGGSGDALRRVVHHSDASRTFVANVPNGNYDVTVYIGHPEWGMAGIDVFAEGTKRVANLPTSAGVVQTRTFNVPISDGQLTLDFKGAVSGAPYWSVAGVDIVPTSTSGTGRISRDVWRGVSGVGVAQIPVSTTPTESDTLTSLETPPNSGENYGTRLRGYLIPPTTGTYTFWIAGDDNCELFIGSSAAQTSKISRAAVNAAPGYTNSREWNRFAQQKSAPITLTGGQRYYLEVLQKEGGGGDCLAVGWLKPGQTGAVPSEVVPGSALAPWDGGASVPGTGLKAQYYSGQSFNTLVQTRTDATVNFNWGNGAAMSSVGPDNFSVRWTGKVKPLHSQTYTFTTTTDDGVRLWVNGQLLIDKWQTQGTTPWSATIALVAGQKYDITMEYFEAAGGAIAKLEWESASQTRQVVPQSQLYPAP